MGSEGKIVFNVVWEAAAGGRELLGGTGQAGSSLPHQTQSVSLQSSHLSLACAARTLPLRKLQVARLLACAETRFHVVGLL